MRIGTGSGIAIGLAALVLGASIATAMYGGDWPPGSIRINGEEVEGPLRVLLAGSAMLLGGLVAVVVVIFVAVLVWGIGVLVALALAASAAILLLSGLPFLAPLLAIGAAVYAARRRPRVPQVPELERGGGI